MAGWVVLKYFTNFTEEGGAFKLATLLKEDTDTGFTEKNICRVTEFRCVLFIRRTRTVFIDCQWLFVRNNLQLRFLYLRVV